MKHKYRNNLIAAVCAALAVCATGTVQAGPAERAQAKRMHDRIAEGQAPR